jgi:hypothetical protein
MVRLGSNAQPYCRRQLVTAIIYFQRQFALGPGESVWMKSWINGERESGGEYHGPAAVAALSTALHQRVSVSTIEIELTARNPDGLTSKCFYWHQVTNNNPFPLSFVQHFLVDG